MAQEGHTELSMTTPRSGTQPHLLQVLASQKKGCLGESPLDLPVLRGHLTKCGSHGCHLGFPLLEI